MTFARVALDVPLPTLFDYALPAGVGDAGGLIGRRVVVPFGRGRQAGVVLDVAPEPAIAAARIRPIESLSEDAPLPADVLDLLRFASDYYHHPIGQVVLGALPQRLRQPRDEAGAEQVELTDAGRQIEPASLPARSVTRSRPVVATGQRRRCVHSHGRLPTAGQQTRPRVVPLPPHSAWLREW
jgi:primosomal protein N' (replication factor Y)